MYEIKQETLDFAYKPFDVVTNDGGAVGFISEVSVNSSQPSPEQQIGYHVVWLVGAETKVAWFSHQELTWHANIFVEIAKANCHPSSSNAVYVETLLNSRRKNNND